MRYLCRNESGYLDGCEDETEFHQERKIDGTDVTGRSDQSGDEKQTERPWDQDNEQYSS